MTQPSNLFFEFGSRLLASRVGMSRQELLRKQAQAAVMESDEAIPFRRELCKIACAAFEADGADRTAPAILFRNLAVADTWHASYNRFTDCVVRALSKQASMLLPAVATLHDKAGGGVMKTLAAGGALGGAALGSLAFLLSRNARQTSAENAMLLEKVKAYKQLRRDIQEDMAEHGVMDADAEEEERYDV